MLTSLSRGVKDLIFFFWGGGVEEEKKKVKVSLGAWNPSSRGLSQFQYHFRNDKVITSVPYASPPYGRPEAFR